MSYFKVALYAYLKFLVRFSFALFYRPTVVIGKERLRLSQPTIIATNHPNTLIDALNAAGRTNRVVYFLVNAGLYHSKLGRTLFNFLYCIPIKRKEDPSAAGVNNNDSFDKCYEHLINGGHIFIAPEGGSIAGRRIRPLKPGTARIALEAQKRAPQGPTIRILPVGFTYSNPSALGSTLVVRVGEPIEVSDFLHAYELDPRTSVKKITDIMASQLKELILHTQSPEEDKVLSVCEQLVQATTPLSPKEQHFRAQSWLKRWKSWKQTNSVSYREFLDTGLQLAENLSKLKITPQALADNSTSSLAAILRLLLGLPLFLFGYINHFLPAIIPWYLAQKQTYSEYKATVQILVGLITFTFFYTLQTVLVWFICGDGYALIYLLLLLPSGLFTSYYQRFWTKIKSQARLKSISTILKSQLLEQRDFLIRTLPKTGSNAPD